MAVLLVWLARCSLLLTLIAAPWAIGGAELPSQRWLVLGILVAGILGWLGAMLRGALRLSRPAALLLMLAAGLLTIGAIQLLPHPHSPEFPRAELTAELGVLDGDDSPAAARSLEPAATRLWMSRLAVAVVAFLSGAWLFGDRSARHWLWAALGVNGIAVVGFGLVQRASWNGKLYWSIPLQLGGQPFAAFVNRNNAAEYLSMCLAGALGLWAASRISERPAAGKVPGIRSPVVSTLASRCPSVVWGVMILLLFGGVLATLSRAGALSSVAGVLLVGAWVGAGRRSRTLLLPLLGIVVAAVAWLALTDQAAQLRSRLGSLGGSYATDGRIRHWMDMRNAVRDFPVLGTGFGTYRYANKPYESHRSESWFESADNQYLDLLVEGGAPAAIIASLFPLLAVWLANAWRRSGHPLEAFACGYVAVAIGLQSLTDCWFATAANLLTLATLAGSLSNPLLHSSGVHRSALEKVEQLMESRRSFFPAAVIGLCAVLAAGLGAYEIHTAAKSTVFRRKLPKDEQRPEITLLEVDGLIAGGDQLLAQRPDDAALHAAQARLLFLRHRLIGVSRLDSLPTEQGNDNVRWRRTSPQALLETLARYEQIGDEASLEQFRDDPLVTENLQPMSRHVRSARRHCAILPYIGLLEAIDELLAGGDPSLPLRREAALSPARVKLLDAIAKSADMIDDEELFIDCLSRCLSIDHRNASEYAQAARSRLSEPAIVERLLPDLPEPLVGFAEAARSTEGRDLALRRAAAALDRIPPDDPELPFLRGRILWLRKDVDGALDQLALAVEASSFDPQRRLLFARVLHADGQMHAAREQVKSAQRLAPDDRKLQARIREVETLLDSQ